MPFPLIPRFAKGLPRPSVPLLLLIAPCAAPVAAQAQDAPPERSAARHPYTAHVAEAARRFGIPDAWIWAVMRVESNGNARAVSTAGALGPMQIMPATWGHLRARYGLSADPFDVRDNIMAGAAYLREMHDRFGNATAMLAAYNAGPGRYDEYLSRGRPLPAETLAYLAKLTAITDGAGETQLAAVSPPDPFDWRRAALFAQRSSAGMAGGPSAGDEVAALPSTDAPTESPAVTIAAVRPSAPSLFVPRTGRPVP